MLYQDKDEVRIGEIMGTIIDAWHHETQLQITIEGLADTILEDYQYQSKEISELKDKICEEMEDRATGIGDIKNDFEVILNGYYDFLTDDMCDEIKRRIKMLNIKRRR